MKRLLLLLVGVIIFFPSFQLCFSQVLVDPIYSVDNLRFSTIDSFDVVELKGCNFYTDEVGKPMLPVQELQILLPKDAKPESISIIFIDSVQVEGEFYIYPAQPPPILDGSLPPPFEEPDSAVYNSDSLYPTIACKMKTSGYMSGYNIMSVFVYPLQYRPLSRRLFLYTEIQLDIVYSHSEDLSLPIYRRSENAQEAVEDYVRALVVNPEDIDRFYGSPDFPLKSYEQMGKLDITDLPSLQGVPVDYVIVTTDEFVPVFEQLAEWKTKKGIVTIVRSEKEIINYYYGCDDAERLRNFLKDCYSLWGTVFVLLAGDMDVIPIRYGFTDPYDVRGPSDLYFSCLEGTWNADGDHIFGEIATDEVDLYWDVWRGRAPVSNLEGAELFVNKVLFYEKTPPETDYIEKMLLLGASHGRTHEPDSTWHGDGWGAKKKEALQLYLGEDIEHLTLWKMYGPKDDLWYTPPDPPQWEGNEELTVENMFNRINEGYHFINHMGHAGAYVIDAGVYANGGWYGIKEASDQINTNKYSIFWSVGCGPNPFDYESMAEVLVNNPNGGCVAFVGNTRTAWGIVWQEKYFWKGIFTELYKLGWSFSRITIPGGDLEVRNMNLLGDPEMPVWTYNPKPLQVKKPHEIVGLGTHTIQIKVMDPTSPEPQPIEGALVCLLKGDEAFGSKETDINGEVAFSYRPESTGEILVTVTAHNFFPYEGEIRVSPTDEPYVCFDSEIIDDDNTGNSVGNGDGVVNPGETVEMHIILINNGLEIAQRVKATLSLVFGPVPQPVEIIVNEQKYGDIPPENSAQSFYPYVFRVLPECESGYEINFQLKINEGPIERWADNFVVKVLADSLFHTRHIVTINDVNGNGILDPNEEVYIDSLEITNYGQGGADDVEARLTPEVSGITMIKDYCFIGDVPGYSYVTIPPELEPHCFVFKCDPVPAEFKFTLTLTDRFDREWKQIMDLSTPYPPDVIWSDLFGQDFCSIDWKFVNNAKDPDICGYNIFRSFSESGTYERINALLEVDDSKYRDCSLFNETEYWYKVRSVDTSGNESDDSPVFHLKTNPPFQIGWPKIFTKPTDGNWSSTKVGDIDGDDDLEIVMGYRNYIFAYHHEGTLVTGWPKKLQYESYSTPALVDLDGDGTLEIIYCGGENESLYVWKHNGQNFSNQWPLWFEGQYVKGSPLIADLESDGIVEIIVCVGNKVYAYHPDGSLASENWGTVSIEGNIDARFVPSIADLDGDGIYEVILGSFDWNLHSVYINAFDHTGNLVNCGNWPFVFDVGAGNNGSIVSPPSIADFDNDGKQEVVIGSVQPGRIFLLDNNGDELWQITCGDLVSCAPGIVDFNNDHKLDIFFVDFYAHGWAERADLHVVDYQDGNEWLRVSFDYVIRSSPVYDGENIIVKTSDGKVHFFDKEGTEELGAPFYDGQRGDNYSTPTVSDIDLDGDMDIIYSGTDKRMYVWDASTIMNQSAAAWRMFKHDNWNTGNYDFVVPETYSTTDSLATAYNNQRKMTDEMEISVVYSSLDKVFFSISQDGNRLGQKWIIGDGRFPALARYSDATGTEKFLGAVWVNGYRLDFSRYTETTAWSVPWHLVDIVGIGIHFSPPSLMIDDEGYGHLAWEKITEPLHYPGDIKYELHYSKINARLEQPVFIEDEILDEAREYVNEWIPGYVSASLDLDDNNNQVVAWSRMIGEGKNIVYCKQKTGGVWPSEPEIVSSPSEISHHPFCDISNGEIEVVWENEGTIKHRQRPLTGQWSPIYTVSNPQNYSRSPQILDGDVCIYTEVPQLQPDHYSNVVYRMRLGDGNWLSSQIIESTSHLSEYPQCYVEEVSPFGRILHTVWTEGNEAPYEVRYKQTILPLQFSGHIAENTIWDADIYITGDVVINTGITLTINPGLHVMFAPLYDDTKLGIDNNRCELIVAGRLVVEGSEVDSIYFTSAGLEPHKNDWYGLRIASSDTSLLNYVSLAYAKRGISYEQGSVAMLKNSSISNNYTGISATQSTPIIKNCTITDNSSGIYCSNCTNVTIDSCQISNDRYAGLKMKGVENAPLGGPDSIPVSGTGITFSNCDAVTVINNTIVNDYVGVYASGYLNGVFQNNYVEDNEWHGFDIAVTKGSNMQFINNTFINNAKYPVNHNMAKRYYREFAGLSLAFPGIHTGETNVIVKGNTFEGNTCGTRFSKYYTNPSTGTYNVRYEGNQSRNNFYGFALSAPSGASGYEGTFVNNTAELNDSAGVFVWFGIDSGAVNLGNLTNADETDGGGNHILNNNIWQVMNICPYKTYAQGNFWGTTDALQIDSKIYDDEEEPANGEVDFSGYYIAGRIQDGETWEGVISVCGDILVPENATLNIVEGTKVRFTAGYDINNIGVDSTLSELIVDGNLEIKPSRASVGSRESIESMESMGSKWSKNVIDGPPVHNQIVFTSDASEPSPSNWYGIELGGLDVEVSPETKDIRLKTTDKKPKTEDHRPKTKNQNGLHTPKSPLNRGDFVESEYGIASKVNKNGILAMGIKVIECC